MGGARQESFPIELESGSTGRILADQLIGASQVATTFEIQKATDEWDLVIRPKRHWLDLQLGDLWRYRDLILLFFWRDFVAVYKQTILGPLWYLVQPLLTTIIFTVVFGNVARIPTDGLPPFLFYLSGLTIWGYFASCLTKTSNTFVSNAHIFGKVYFPRLTVPLSILLSNLVAFGIQFVFFIAFLIYFFIVGAPVHPNVAILLTPVLLLILAGLSLGFGILVSSLTTRYRDLIFLITFGVQLWMYATTVIYPLSSIPDRFRWLILANPVTPIIEAFRFAFLGAGSFDSGLLLYSFLFMLAVLLTGAIVFNRVERNFMDTV